MSHRHLFIYGIVVSACGLAAGAQARPDDVSDTSELFRFDAGDEILTFDTEHFRLHYTVAGVHAVPVADEGDGVPDHVADLGREYEDVLTFYTTELGFRPPLSDADTALNNGGDDRFDVYLVDFNFNADGTFRAERCSAARCSGYMVQENDFDGYGYPSVAYANRVLASHEFFHAVQSAYDREQSGVFSEGTAVWATERFDGALRDLEGFAGGYLDEASSSLDRTAGGAVDPFSYGAGIFFLSLSDRFGDGIIRRLWEAVEDGAGGVEDPEWANIIDDLLQAEAGVSFADAFAEFAVWTLFTGERADPERSFANGAQMAERPLEPIGTPADESTFTVFRASSRAVSALANGRSEMAAALVGDASDLDGLRMYLLPIAPGRTAEVIEAQDPTHVTTTAMGSYDELVVLVVNTRLQGQGARPRLCVGSPSEVEACVVAEEAPPPTPPGEPPVGWCASLGDSGHGLFSLLLLGLAQRRRRSCAPDGR